MRLGKTIDILKYLIQREPNKRELAKKMGVSLFTINNVIHGDMSIGSTTTDRINDYLVRLIKFDIHYAVTEFNTNNKKVINYENDESLTDLKTYNTSHGVNKSSRCHTVHTRGEC